MEKAPVFEGRNPLELIFKVLENISSTRPFLWKSKDYDFNFYNCIKP